MPTKIAQPSVSKLVHTLSLPPNELTIGPIMLMKSTTQPRILGSPAKKSMVSAHDDAINKFLCRALDVPL